MAKNTKELIVVLLAGAGTIAIMWGAFATKQVTGIIVRQPEWKAIGIGAGVLVIAALIGFLVKAKA
jgi:uncharacterized integral membrane protein